MFPLIPSPLLVADIPPGWQKRWVSKALQQAPHLMTLWLNISSSDWKVLDWWTDWLWLLETGCSSCNAQKIHTVCGQHKHQKQENIKQTISGLVILLNMMHACVCFAARACITLYNATHWCISNGFTNVLISHFPFSCWGQHHGSWFPWPSSGVRLSVLGEICQECWISASLGQRWPSWHNFYWNCRCTAHWFNPLRPWAGHWMFD